MRRAAHCVNVVQRIDRRDPSIRFWVIGYRSKKIDRLHERDVIRKAKNTRIVGCFKSDDDIFGRLCRKFAQNLSKVTRGEFCHSTGARDHFGQPFHIPSRLAFALNYYLIDPVEVVHIVILDLNLATRSPSGPYTHVGSEFSSELCLGSS